MQGLAHGLPACIRHHVARRLVELAAGAFHPTFFGRHILERAYQVAPYLAGFLFVVSAVLTEAVSGIVGIADVLGGMGAVLALAALSLPAWAMPFGVFTAVVFGLFCKESALVCVPLIPFTALVAAPLTHPERPARALRALLALVPAFGAFSPVASQFCVFGPSCVVPGRLASLVS